MRGLLIFQAVVTALGLVLIGADICLLFGG